MSYTSTQKLILDKLTKSSEESYEAFKIILDNLRNESTRKATRIFLGDILKNDELRLYFDFVEIPISQIVGWKHLSLIQLRSTFAPEEWSYTFYEGLNRYPEERFIGKDVCEVGCGNGWITLGLAIKTGARKVYGLDINPKAIVLSKINLFLNALDDKGLEKKLESGNSLLGVAEFYESNLLGFFIDGGQTLDLITGCIPQVLSPDADMKFSDIKETFSDDELYDLSNYAPSLGYVEDQFGLALIAKVLEQSIEVLNPSGRVVLNLGGRPGNEVLQSLFERRGFSCEKIWQTKVWQAKDTNIDSLVKIENSSAHRFEFYTSLTNDVSINASLAKIFNAEGGQVAHSLCVYEGKLEFPNQIKKIHSFLKSGEFQDVLNHLDLSIVDRHILEEKVEFLTFLAGYLKKKGTFGYENVAGVTSFREMLSLYLFLYFKLSVNKDDILVAPSRVDFFCSLLGTFQFSKLLISESYMNFSVDSKFKKIFRYKSLGTEVLESPPNVEVLAKLVTKIRPDILITEISESESHSTVAVERLIKSCKEVGTKLFLDVSNTIELTSQPTAHAVFRYLSEHEFGPDVTLFGSFVHNAVYEKLVLCFVLSKNKSLIDNLKYAAELTYSRVPVIPQLYYEAILTDLLDFQLSALKVKKTREVRNEVHTAFSIPLKESAQLAFKHNAILAEKRVFNEDSLRLDYGENELGVGVSFKRSVFESFAKKSLQLNENLVKGLLRAKLKNEFGITADGDFLFGLGAAPIYSELTHMCVAVSASLLFPKGNYGMFYAAAQYSGCNIIEVEVSEKSNFKLTPSILNQELKKRKKGECWVYLQYPILNPSGQLLQAEELNALLKVIQSHQAKVIIDTVFGGLLYSESKLHVRNEVYTLAGSSDRSENIDAVVIGGPSKEYAAGGLRVGFAWSTNKEILTWLSQNLSHPHHTSLAVFQDILLHAQERDSDVITRQEEQRLTLSLHAQKLTSLLTAHAWKVLVPVGGLFLIARPPDHYPGDFSEFLFVNANISINSPEWTGIENYYRFVLSVDTDKFSEALDRLEKALIPLKK